MRTIDADALKELFSEVIGHIAKKPEMNGNLEHMIRASAMVIQMIDDAPTVQPDTTTHDSIPAKTGGNDEDRTSGDCISRTQAIMAIEQHRIAVLEGHKWDEGIEYGYAAAHRHLVDIIENLPFAQPETNCSEIPNNSDTISRQAAIEAMSESLKRVFPEHRQIAEKCLNVLPSAQPERTCVNCGRTANNGGWYADGRTRCPIEEHYALPKDGYCHLWEKRNVTDDNYPERREE